MKYKHRSSCSPRWGSSCFCSKRRNNNNIIMLHRINIHSWTVVPVTIICTVPCRISYCWNRISFCRIVWNRFYKFGHPRSTVLRDINILSYYNLKSKTTYLWQILNTHRQRPVRFKRRYITPNGNKSHLNGYHCVIKIL